MTSRFARSWRATRVGPTDIPASPPPEVLDAIGAADAVYERLAASGRHVRLDLDAQTGRLVCELTDDEGTCLGRLSPRALLDLATGTTPTD
ncbi:MAG TPA: hypothetical protein VGH67_09135 [Solirubrobacteraceae bacterium]|jgi:hypothetical protein